MSGLTPSSRAATRARFSARRSTNFVACASSASRNVASSVAGLLALGPEVGAVEDVPVPQHRHDHVVVVQAQVVDPGLRDDHRAAPEARHRGARHLEADDLLRRSPASSRRARSPAPRRRCCGRRPCAGSRPWRSGRASGRRSGRRSPCRCCGARPGSRAPGRTRRPPPRARSCRRSRSPRSCSPSGPARARPGRRRGSRRGSRACAMPCRFSSAVQRPTQVPHAPSRPKRVAISRWYDGRLSSVSRLVNIAALAVSESCDCSGTSPRRRGTRSRGPGSTGRSRGDATPGRSPGGGRGSRRRRARVPRAGAPVWSSRPSNHF